MLPSMANVFRVQLSFGHGNGHHEEHAFNDTDSADSNLIVAPLTIFSSRKPDESHSHLIY